MILMEEISIKVWSAFVFGFGCYIYGLFVGWLSFKPKNKGVK